MRSTVKSFAADRVEDWARVTADSEISAAQRSAATDETFTADTFAKGRMNASGESSPFYPVPRDREMGFRHALQESLSLYFNQSRRSVRSSGGRHRRGRGFDRSRPLGD